MSAAVSSGMVRTVPLSGIVAIAALLGLATVAHAATCAPPTPMDCGFGCCAADQTCNPAGEGCCPAGFPVPCQNGQCCPAATTCNIGTEVNRCCNADFPVPCPEGHCCPAGRQCGPGGTCGCPTESPVQCEHACCPAGSTCSADGASCLTANMCADPNPVDCRNGSCCPAGDRCENVPLSPGSDVLVPYCCLDLPQEGCCPRTSARSESHESAPTAVTNARTPTQCRKSTKVRPFDVMDVAAGSKGTPASFDIANTDYSVAFALKGKQGGRPVVLKVPIIREDSTATSLAVMIPPYMLRKESQGKADVFLLTDGVMSETCLGRVRIAKLPKSASKVPGLATASWLRANQALYGAARSTLTSAAAAPFVNPAILPDVDSAITSVGGLIPSYSGLAKKSPLLQTAKHSDSLLTGMLTAAQKVADPAFASACAGWVQALAGAKDTGDASLKAAEDAFVNVVLSASGPSALNVAKFVTACGAVTTAGMASSAVMIAGGGAVSPAVDAQATSVVICGATVTACGVITGVTAVAAGVTIRPGQTAYGKALLQGAAQVAASTRTNHGGLNLATAKVCGCQQPGLQGVIDVIITVINTGDHIRIAAPQYCLPDGPARSPTPTTTTTVPTSGCGNGVVEPGEECESAAACGQGRSCEACRCVGTGDVRVTLLWDTVDDLDLHVTEPSGTEIFWGSRTSPSGGALDVDSNAACANPQANPVENVFWSAGSAPSGTYTVKVDYWRHCGTGPETVPFTVKTLVDGVERSFSGSVSTPDMCSACTEARCMCSTVTTFNR